jgi:ABC-type transport system involved in multi-copper enzyme maturation permease subunit
MLNNPIVRRELMGTLRTRRSAVALVGSAVVFAGLVMLRWPTDARVDLSGIQSQEVLRLFGYGLTALLLLVAPVFPATSFVREKQQGTLVLLLNSPLGPWAILAGKLAGCLGLLILLLAVSLPGAAACYAMGGASWEGEIAPLYGVLLLLALQCAAFGLWVSLCANSTDAALRYTFAGVLAFSVVALGPHYFFQGTGGLKAVYAEHLRCLSPVPAVMEILGDAGVGAQGITAPGGVVMRYAVYSLAETLLFFLLTLRRLNHTLFDRPRSQGTITDDQPVAVRSLRRLLFVVDPQRRKLTILPLVNPVMVKEFRCRRFGRMHWMLRLAAVSAVGSLGLTYAASMGTLDWGPETIGGIMVLFQAALIVLLTPSLTAGLISAEVESGGWQLLQMTPLSTGTILRGKLISVLWPVSLILVSTLPGYMVMVYIQPEEWLEVRQAVLGLVMTALLSISVSFAASTLFRRAAAATAAAYGVLGVLCVGTMLIWALRGAPFSHTAVEQALTVNPVAAALSVIQAPGFAEFRLIPRNWWFCGVASGLSAVVALVQTHRLSRPR